MTRTLLQYVLPLLLPTLVFVGWVMLTRGNGGKGVMARLSSGPWFWLIFIGCLLTGGLLVAVALTGGDDPGTTYVAPHIEGEGIVPGQFK
jgi:hypothetical protein